MLASARFEQGGIHIMRHRDLYMIVDCGRHGLKDWGGHAHNDTLGFEICVSSTTFIIDPGSYIYTASADWHQRFRTTAYHNTIAVDHQEMNRFKPGDFWGLHNDAVPYINAWYTGAIFDLLDAQHSGYERLASPVLHRRQIFFHKQPPYYWLIRDLLTGKGEHSFDMYFHIGAANIVGNIDSLGIVLGSQKEVNMYLAIVPLTTEELTLQIEDTWRAPSYGTRIKGKSLRYSRVTRVPTEFAIVLWPYKTPTSLKRIVSQAHRVTRPTLDMLKDEHSSEA